MIELIQSLGMWGWAIPIVAIIAVFFFIRYLKSRNKQVDLDEVSVGPVKLKLKDIPVSRVAFLTQPKDASGRPASLSEIRVRAYDEKNRPLQKKKITIELESYSGTDYLRGILTQYSDETGTASFSGLKISRSGQYVLIAKSDGIIAMSVPFEVTPPGLDTNFSDKLFNSQEYKDSLARKLSLSKAEDELKFDEEDI